MSDKLAVIEATAELVEETSAPLAVDKPYIAEKLRVVEIIAVDYIWNEEKHGFFPVFGAPHAGAPVLVPRDAPRLQPTPRKLKP